MDGASVVNLTGRFGHYVKDLGIGDRLPVRRDEPDSTQGEDCYLMYAGTMPDIRITVDGEPALTVELAAARHGIKRKSMSGELSRHPALRPVADLDGRKKLYRAADIDAMMAGRPGKGANLRRTP